MFKDFSTREIKFYLGFGFLFFILCTFIFSNIFFSFIYDSNLSLYLVLTIHDTLYFLIYFIDIYLLAFFFKLNLKRTILFTIPQFYIYEYLSGLFVEGLSYFIIAPKVILLRLIIIVLGTFITYLSLKFIVEKRDL